MQKLKLLLPLVAFLLLLAPQSNGQSCTASFGYPNSVLKTGDTISFTDYSTYSSSRVFYDWSFGDGSYAYNQNPIHIYSKPGVYMVCLTISDSMSNCYDTYCDSIFIGSSGSSCSAEFSYTVGTGSNDKDVNFTNKSTYSGTSATYSWNFGDNNTSTKTSPNHAYSSYGNYTVELEVTSGTCSDKIKKVISLKNTTSTCKADFSYVQDSTNQCVIYFNNKSGNGYSTYWSFGDGSISTAWAPTHKYTSNGYYGVSLTVFDSARSCSNTYTDTIYVQGCGSSSSCSIDIDADKVNACTYDFEATLGAGMSSSSVYWSFGDGSSSTGTTVTHTYTTQGYYNVLVYYFDSSSSCQAQDTVRVYAGTCSSNSCNLYVGGQVFVGNNFAEYGKVYLIQKDSNLLTAVDTTYIDSVGTYYFSNVCKGDYYIKVALDSIDQNYLDYMPTYYGGELRWDSVSSTSISQTSFGLDINMVKGNNLGGQGFIGGDVRKGANKKAGEPLGQIQIVIQNENFEAVAYTYSSSNGEFEFPSLAYGKYYLFVDIPGVSSEGTWIVLDEQNPKETDVYVEVNTNGVSTNVETIGLLASTNLNVYPNPASNFVVVNSAIEQKEVSIFTLSGKCIYKISVKASSTTVNVSEIQKGFYILNVKFSNGTQVNEPIVFE